MAKSWGHEQLVWDILWWAKRCELTPADLNDRAELRYGVPFRDLTDENLTHELKALKILHASLNDPRDMWDRKKGPKIVPPIPTEPDQRTASEIEWDREILNG